MVLVAEVDDRVVGVCQVIIFRQVHHQGSLCAEIESMHVAEGFRGKGIGGKLVDEAAMRASDLGCYRLQLTSNVARPDAHRFYERHGSVASHVGFKRSLEQSRR